MKRKKQAFTLIELIVVITIFFIMVGLTYEPYTYYTKKQKVRNTGKEIARSIYEARNMAINWFASDSNVSIGVAFDSQEEYRDVIRFFSYPHSFSGSQIQPVISDDIQLIKTYKLQPGIQIDSVADQKNALFFFWAISGIGEYSYRDATNIKQTFWQDTIPISFSFWWAETWSPLAWQIQYLTKTNIIDYE